MCTGTYFRYSERSVIYPEGRQDKRLEDRRSLGVRDSEVMARERLNSKGPCRTEDPCDGGSILRQFRDPPPGLEMTWIKSTCFQHP